jgi:hypothetical protein
MRNTFVLLITALFCAGAIACAGWSPERKALACKTALDTLAAPECARLDVRGDGQYGVLCREVVEDGKAACDAGFLDNPVLMCARISEKSDECARIAGDNLSEEDVFNIATCERIINGLSLTCTLALSEPPAPEPVPAPSS